MPDIKKFSSLVKQLQDIKTVGLIVIAVIVLLVSWSGVGAVERNFTLQKQIARLEQENAIQKLKNQNQALQNEYYNSDQYLELSARQNFGLAAPGEKLLIVPNNVAMSYTVDPPKPTSPEVAKSSNSAIVRNLKAWQNFILGRHDNSQN